MSESPPDPLEAEPSSIGPLPPSASRVVILGASVAGLKAAITLDRLLIGRRDIQVILLDQHAHHQPRGRLPGVVAGEIRPQDAKIPIRRLLCARRIIFVRGHIEGLDLSGRAVLADGGALPYRWLILTLGVESAPSGVPGLDSIAAEVWSVEDARRLRDRALEQVRQAAWKLDEHERARLSTFAVIGGSRFGVELAGALGERVRSLTTDFRLSAGDGRVLLVEPADRVLPSDSRAVGELAARALERAGVEIRVGSALVEASAAGVLLASGEQIPAGLIVRTSPGQAPTAVRAAGAAVGREGALLVDRELRLPEHPGAYAAGPGTVLIGDEVGGERGEGEAARQGEVAARNVYAEIAELAGLPAGRRRVEPAPSDVVLSIGRTEAVGLVRGVAVEGWRARLALQACELAYLEAIGGPGGLLANLPAARLNISRLLGG